MSAGRFFFASQLTDRSSNSWRLPLTARGSLNKLIPIAVRQAHHERNQELGVRPELVEGLVQYFRKYPAAPVPCLSTFPPGNFFADHLDRTVIYQGGFTMNTNATQTLDTRGMNCPLPILRTKKTLSAMGAGEVLAVTATDPGSLKDMQAFCKQTGNELIASSANQGEFEFLIRKS